MFQAMFEQIEIKKLTKSIKSEKDWFSCLKTVRRFVWEHVIRNK